MKIIVISGKAGSGKDTFGALLSDSLKEMGHKTLITHYADLLKYIAINFFSWDGQKDKFGRDLLQHLGTDVVRANDKNFWVDFLIRVFQFFPDEWDFVIIPDCRFPNEIERFKECGYQIKHIRVWRNEQDNTIDMTEAQKMHESEIALDEFEPDWAVANVGTLSCLLDAAKRIAEELTGMSIGESIRGITDPF